MESIMEYSDESKKQVIDHFSYNIVDFAQSEEFIIELCKKVINSEEENKEFMKKWIEENVF